MMMCLMRQFHCSFFFFFFFNDTATTEIYTLSLHDALPISCYHIARQWSGERPGESAPNRDDGLFLHPQRHGSRPDRKSTRLNSSHMSISYAVFCLKKKKQKKPNTIHIA